VVHDGGDFLEHAGFGVVLDNLMHRRLIAESFVAFVSPRDRMREYGAGRAHSRFLAEELVPELEAKLPLQGDPCGRVLLGASLGAVASLAAAARAPGMFGGLMLESGSFRATLSDLRQAPPRLRSMVRFLRSLQRDAPHVTHRVFQAYGRFEPLVDANRTMTATLRRMADEVRVVEALDGHNWTAWRDRLLDGLGWLLPPEAEAAARPAGEVVVP
jgi:enterochelin esterase family protein